MHDCIQLATPATRRPGTGARLSGGVGTCSSDEGSRKQQQDELPADHGRHRPVASGVGRCHSTACAESPSLGRLGFCYAALKQTSAQAHLKRHATSSPLSLSAGSSLCSETEVRAQKLWKIVVSSLLVFLVGTQGSCNV